MKITVLLAACAALAISPITMAATNACNNSPELCSRTYNNITYMGAHDSAFLRDASTNYSVAGNQFYNATTALSAGVRLLQAQVHNLNGVLQLCHSSCQLLNAGTLQDWLARIKYWMDNNTNDVVTILLVNSDNNSTASFGSAFTGSGIASYGYTPTSNAGGATWPTLQSLILNNSRLVTFITNIETSASYPYLLPEFSHIFETAYGQTEVPQFNCNIDRPSGLASASLAISMGYMPLLNHFRYTDVGFGITTPDIANITLTNSNSSITAGSLFSEAHSCSNQWGIKPTFILVDFFNVGSAISTADLLNGIVGSVDGRINLSMDVLTGNSAIASASMTPSVTSSARLTSSSFSYSSSISRTSSVANTSPTASKSGSASSLTNGAANQCVDRHWLWTSGLACIVCAINVLLL